MVFVSVKKMGVPVQEVGGDARSPCHMGIGPWVGINGFHALGSQRYPAGASGLPSLLRKWTGNSQHM